MHICPVCTSAIFQFLGMLGDLFWYRCKGCGLDHPKRKDQYNDGMEDTPQIQESPERNRNRETP